MERITLEDLCEEYLDNMAELRYTRERLRYYEKREKEELKELSKKVKKDEKNIAKMIGAALTGAEPEELLKYL